MAPVKEPFSCPKSSLSTRFSGHEGRIAAGTAVVQSRGHQLLAGSRLTLDEDGHRGRGRSLDELKDILDLLRFTDDFPVFGDRSQQVAVGLEQGELFIDPLEVDSEGLDRLREDFQRLVLKGVPGLQVDHCPCPVRGRHRGAEDGCRLATGFGFGEESLSFSLGAFDDVDVRSWHAIFPRCPGGGPAGHPAFSLTRQQHSTLRPGLPGGPGEKFLEEDRDIACGAEVSGELQEVCRPGGALSPSGAGRLHLFQDGG